MRELGALIGIIGILMLAACGGSGGKAEDLAGGQDIWSDVDAELLTVPDSGGPLEVADAKLPADLQDSSLVELLPPDLTDSTPETAVAVDTDAPDDLGADLEIGCQPQCEDKECGDDGCGGECGPCPDGQSCSGDQCIYPAKVVPVWNTGFSGNGVALAADIASDGSGSLYVCGTFIVASVDFGGGPVNGKGGEDIYLVKLGGAGELLWVKTFGGANKDFCRGVAGDGSGGVFMVGGFSSADLDLGGGVLPHGGGTDILLARFDGDGEHVWSSSYGIDEDEAAWDAAVDGDGALYVTGRFGGQYASTMSLGDIELSSNDKADIFVTRFDGDGQPSWARAFGGANVAHGREIVVGSDGRIVVAGEFFNDGVPFKYGGSEETTLGMGWNIFVLLLDSNGEEIWAKTFGANGDDAVRGVTLDGQQNVTLVGHGQGTPTLDFGLGPTQSTGSEDLFAARFDSEGNPVWAKLLGAPGATTQAASVASNNNGDIFLLGHFSGTTLDLGGTELNAKGGTDIFLARYAADGDLTWATSFGTTDNETGVAMLRHPSGALAITGGFEGTSMEFGLAPVTNSLVATPAVYVTSLLEE